MLPGCSLFTTLFNPREPVPRKIHGHTVYEGLFGGLIWLFIVSNHSEVLPDVMFLSENGQLPFLVIDVPGFESFSEESFAGGNGDG